MNNPDNEDPEDDGRIRTDTQRVQDGRFNTKRRITSVEMRTIDSLGEAVKVRQGGVGSRVLVVRVFVKVYKGEGEGDG
jgi:hypothetical protein